MEERRWLLPFTHGVDVLRSIRWLTQEWCCTDIVIVMRDHTTIFLKPHEARELCTEPPRRDPYLSKT